jgi:lipid-A-disaccharide synthase
VSTEDWGVIGIVEAVLRAPKLIWGFERVKRILAAAPPDLVVLVDYGEFNVRLAKWIRSHLKSKICYYMPPGSWRRHQSPSELGELAKLIDLFITPFVWSAENLKAVGANVAYVGHPLVDQVVPILRPGQLNAALGIAASAHVVSMLPGSRTQEVTHVLPVLVQAAIRISRAVPGVQFLIPLSAASKVDEVVNVVEDVLGRENAASSIDVRRLLAESLNDVRVPAERRITSTITVCAGMTYDAIDRSDMVVATSGTVTLEAAILAKPMVIVYRASRAMEIEWHLRKRFLHIDHIGLPNILAERRICPELMQDEANPEDISKLVVDILTDDVKRRKIATELTTEVASRLGAPGAVDRAAVALLPLLSSLETHANV